MFGGLKKLLGLDHPQQHSAPVQNQQRVADQIYNASGGPQVDPAVLGYPADTTARAPMGSGIGYRNPGLRVQPLQPTLDANGQNTINPQDLYEGANFNSQGESPRFNYYQPQVAQPTFFGPGNGAPLQGGDGYSYEDFLRRRY